LTSSFDRSGWTSRCGGREAKMIFVNSMSDLFHKEVPFKFIDRVFDTMEKALA
jgi:protein gp37